MLSEKALTKLKATLIILVIAVSLISASLLLVKPHFITEQSKFVNIVDMTGQTVKLSTPVDRVIILQSYWAEAACMLGGGDRIVGIAKDIRDSLYVPDLVKNRTVVGDVFTGINIETVATLKPSVVITDIGYGKTEDIAKSLQDLGIPVVRLFCRSFRDQLEAIKIIGAVLDSSTRAEELVNYLSSEFSKIEDVASQIPEKEKPRVLMLSSIKEGLVATYSNSTWGRAIEDVGGINVAYREFPAQAWPKVSVEKVLAWNPQIIVVVSFDEKTLSGTVQLLRGYPWNITAAARSGMIYGLLAGGRSREAFLDWGPRMLIGYMQLAKMIQPQYFKDLDWRKEADTLLTKFYGVKRYITVKDVRGKEVTLPHPIEKAVVLEGYEIVAALGVFGKVVGIQEYEVRDYVLQRVVPNIKSISVVAPSGAATVNVETLLALRPDAVITWNVYPKPINATESIGIPVLAIYVKNYTQLKETILLLGKIFGKEERADEITAIMDNVIAFVENRTRDIHVDQRLKALLISNLETKGSPRVSGWGTAHSQAFEQAGLVDITKGRLPPPGYGNVPLETVVEWNPDIIFLWPRMWSRCTAEDIYNDPAWQQVNAVKNHRVYQLPLMSSWAPEYALDTLFYAVKAYPDRFNDVNFDEFYKNFTEKVYGVPLEPYYGE